MIHLCPPRRITGNDRTAMTTRAKWADLVENVEWLLHLNRGEHEIMQATGYPNNQRALKRRLRRANRPDLIPRIFTYDATLYDRRIEQ